MKKNKHFKRFLLSLYSPVKIFTIIMFVSMMLSQVCNIIKQYIIKNIIDLPSIPNFDIKNLYYIIIILIAIIIIEIIFFYVSNIIRTICIVKRQSPYITQKLFNNLQNKNYKFFTDNYSGKISSAINEIIDETNSLNSVITTGFISTITVIVSNIIILLTININIFIISVILFSGIIITRLIYFSKKYLPLIKKASEYGREYGGMLNDAILNFNSLKIYNAVENYSVTLRSKREKLNYYSNSASKKEFTYGVAANIVYLIILIILIFYSINLYRNGFISLGDFVFFINAMITLKSSTTSFSWIYIQIGEILIRMKNSYELLYKGNNAIDNNKDDIVIEDSSIIFDDVNFKYTNNMVLKNFNLKIKSQEKIGIIGVSGAGKTTLVNLLFKYYLPQSGQIKIGNKNIQDYNSKSLYNLLTYVPQETILFHATIYDNIKIAKPDATYEEIIEASKKAELHNFIENLDKKYKTIVGERGIKLSGGQRQRIALARIFLKNAKIVIFDEATSSLDNKTETVIQKNINNYFNKQTIICIAHRLSTLKEMDRIIVIDNGKIIDEGIPEIIIPKYDKINYLNN